MRGSFVLLLFVLTPIAGAANLGCPLIEKRVSLEFVEVREQMREHQRHRYAVFKFTNNSGRERRLAVRGTDPLEVSEPEARLEMRRTPGEPWNDALATIGTFTTPMEWLVIDPTGQATLFYEIHEQNFDRQSQARVVLHDETHCAYRSDAFTVPATQATP